MTTLSSCLLLDGRALFRALLLATVALPWAPLVLLMLLLVLAMALVLVLVLPLAAPAPLLTSAGAAAAAAVSPSSLLVTSPASAATMTGTALAPAPATFSSAWASAGPCIFLEPFVDFFEFEFVIGRIFFSNRKLVLRLCWLLFGLGLLSKLLLELAG